MFWHVARSVELTRIESGADVETNVTLMLTALNEGCVQIYIMRHNIVNIAERGSRLESYGL
jgi:hypothetical protein